MVAGALILLLMTSLLFASLVLWALASARVARGAPILEAEAYRPAPWGLLDLIVAIGLLLVLQVAALAVVQYTLGVQPGAERGISDYLGALWANAICTCLAFGLSVGWIVTRTKATPFELGFVPHLLGRDILLGMAAFLMLAPIVFGLQMIMVLIMGPTQHPLILLLQETPDLGLFAVASLNAVIVAPIVEEYFFRGLLQGWFANFRTPWSPQKLLFGGRDEPILATFAQADTTNFKDAGLPGEMRAATGNPYESAIPVEPVLLQNDDLLQRPGWARVWLPIVFSSILFALAHWGHGPDLIPLFALAMGLGFLYQRTGRLMPSIVVHFLLNATSMLLLAAQLYLSK